MSGRLTQVLLYIYFRQKAHRLTRRWLYIVILHLQCPLDGYPLLLHLQYMSHNLSLETTFTFPNEWSLNTGLTVYLFQTKSSPFDSPMVLHRDLPPPVPPRRISHCLHLQYMPHNLSLETTFNFPNEWSLNTGLTVYLFQTKSSPFDSPMVIHRDLPPPVPPRRISPCPSPSVSPTSSPKLARYEQGCDTRKPDFRVFDQPQKMARG